MITHSTAGRVVWKSRRMVGIATVSTELSSTTMSAETTTTASVIHRRGSGTAGVIGRASLAGVTASLGRRHAVWPPSMTNSAPVEYELSSDTSQSASLATSSGCA